MHPLAQSVASWPWTWLRVAFYTRTVRNIHERAAMDDNPKTAIPPKRMWFDNDEVDAWFKSRRKKK